jgi:hypothetical protein
MFRFFLFYKKLNLAGNSHLFSLTSSIRCQRCKEKYHERWEYEHSCGRNMFEVVKESEIIYNPTEVNQLGNKYNIDFDCSCEEKKELDIIFFNTLVNKELQLRRLLHSGNLEERSTTSHSVHYALRKPWWGKNYHHHLDNCCK